MLRIAFIALMCLPLFGSQQSAISARQWLCRMYNGKGDSTMTIRESHSVNWFARHLPEFDPEVAWRVKNENGWKDLRAEVLRSGKMAGRDLVYVLFRIPTRPSPVGKLVLLEDHGNFRPVLWTLADTDVSFAPPRILNVSNTAILMNRDAVSGTGNFYYEDYFIFDDSLGIPVNLNFDKAVHDELKRILPAGRSVRKGGGFEIESLRYSAGVWTEGDANCCPSAGTVKIDFGLLGNSLVVKNSIYVPATKQTSR